MWPHSKYLRYFCMAFLTLVTACEINYYDDLDDDRINCEERCEYGVYYYNSYSVETISLEALKNQIRVEDPKPYEATGKFYFYNDLLFVNEPQKGLHVLDVSDPSNIQKIKFIRLPGNIEISIRNGKMYADLYSAVVTIDISDLANNRVEVEGANTGIFDYYTYQEAWKYVEDHNPRNDRPKQLEYEEINAIEGLGETVFISGIRYNGVRCACDYWVMYEDGGMFNAEVANDSAGAGNQTGTGGSLARFKVIDNYLYTLNNQAIKIFRFDNSGALQNWSTVNVDWGIETLYRLEDLLFIGSMSGMYIYDIEDPGNPLFISEYEHFRACDPVVAEGDYAYVTLRNTNQWCAGDVNQLQIIDVTDLRSPTLLSIYNMNAPYGLAVRGDRVLVCDASSGLKIIDVSDKTRPTVAGFVGNIDARDIILIGNTAYVVTTNGVMIYDVMDIDNPRPIGQQVF